MFQFIRKNDTSISLHDCRAEKITMEGETLSFIFPDGIWLTEQVPKEIVKTRSAQVDFEIMDKDFDGVEIFLFKKNRSGKVIREEWELENFMNAVNEGAFQVEFLYKYQGYQSILYKCWVWFDKAPYSYECEITLHAENVTYNWNEIDYDRVW